jgi:hypothetical protein
MLGGANKQQLANSDIDEQELVKQHANFFGGGGGGGSGGATSGGIGVCVHDLFLYPPSLYKGPPIRTIF